MNDIISYKDVEGKVLTIRGQKALMQKSGELLMDVLSNDALEVSGDETTFELNLAFMKFKRTVKRNKKASRNGKGTVALKAEYLK